MTQEIQAIYQRGVFVEALQQSDLRFVQRVKVRTVYMMFPKIRDRVDDYIEALCKDQGHDVATMANGDLIKIIIDNLPEIIAFIELLMKLFM